MTADRRSSLVAVLITAALVLPGEAIAQTANSPDVRSFFNAPRPSLVYAIAHENIWPDRQFTIWCEGPSILASVDMLQPSDLSAWLVAEAPTRFEVDGERAASATLFATGYSNYTGWTATMIVDGEAAWLERMASSGDVVVTTPIASFSLPQTAEAVADLTAFVDACEAARFGQTVEERSAQETRGTERAVLYEPSRCERCVLHQPVGTFGGSASWGLVDGEHGTEIRAEILIPERDISLTLSIWKSTPETEFDGDYYVDIEVHSFLSTTAGFDPGKISVIAPADNATNGMDGLTGVDPATEIIDPELTRHRVTAEELLYLTGRDLIAFYDFSRPSPLLVEIGDTGRAVFAEAMAVWGIEAAAD